MADRLEISVDRRTYRAMGTSGIGFGSHPVPRGRSGYVQKPDARFVEGIVVFDEPVTCDFLERIEGATVRLFQVSGYSMTLRNARAEHAVELRTGAITLKMVGE